MYCDPALRGSAEEAYFEPARRQRLERLRRADLVDQVQVDIKDGRSILGLGHDFVSCPDSIKQRLRHGGDQPTFESMNC